VAIRVIASARALVTLTEAEVSISGSDIAITTSDQMKDNIQRTINYVSELFETRLGRKLIKKNITEYWNGGFNHKFTKYSPVWAYKTSGNKVLIHDNEYDFVTGDIEFTVTNMDDNTVLSTDDYGIDPDTGEFMCDYTLAFDYRLWKVQYTTGYWVSSATVSELWKEQALTAIRYLYDKNISVFSREGESIPNYPKNLPHSVEQFLNEQRCVRA